MIKSHDFCTREHGQMFHLWHSNHPKKIIEAQNHGSPISITINGGFQANSRW
jgi:hypothetical protein